MKSVVAGVALTGLWSFVSLDSAVGCKGYEETQTVAIPELDAAGLAKLLEKNPELALFDANGEATRAKYGVIPGAKLLSHYADYSIAKELPADKGEKLVFYCGSTMCTAAEKSAKKAQSAGYSDVAVMRDGIKGWAKAGKETEKVKGQS